MKTKHSEVYWLFERIRNMLAMRKAGGVVDESALQRMEALAEEGKKLADGEVERA